MSTRDLPLAIDTGREADARVRADRGASVTARPVPPRERVTNAVAIYVFAALVVCVVVGCLVRLAHPTARLDGVTLILLPGLLLAAVGIARWRRWA
jgi:hypothetical protein